MSNTTKAVADVRRGCTSASNAPADNLCAGRHIAQIGLPDVETEDAKFGQEIHRALFTGDPSKLKPDQQSIYDGCCEIRDAKMREYFGQDFSKVKVVKEERLWCKVRKKYEHSGQPDFIARLGLKALVLEYKTLPGEQAEASTNEQLRDQAVLVHGNLVVPEVTVGVIQPLATYDCVLCTYDEKALKEAERRMFNRIEASNNPLSKRTPHEVACKFCKAKTTCQEYQKWSGATVPATRPLTDVPMAHWTPEQAARFCEMLPVAMKWIETGKDEMKRRLKEDPNSIPGWGLIDGDIRRAITDANELHARFLAIGGTSEQFMQCVEINKGKLEGLTRTVTKLKGKKLFEKIEEMLSNITEAKQNQPSLGRVKQASNENNQVEQANAEAIPQGS